MLDELGQEMEGQVRFSGSRPTEDGQVLQQFALADAQRPFVLLVDDGAEIERAPGLLFGRQGQQWFSSEVAQYSVRRRDDLLFEK